MTFAFIVSIVLFIQIGLGLLKYSKEEAFEGFGFRTIADAVLHSDQTCRIEQGMRRFQNRNGYAIEELNQISIAAESQAAAVTGAYAILCFMLPYNLTRWAMHTQKIQQRHSAVRPVEPKLKKLSS